MAATLDEVVEIVSTEGGIAPEKLRSDVTLAELDISSLDLASILFEMEDRFDIEIDPARISPEMDLGALVDHVNTLCA
ncbi:acyl carrier protein [Sphingobium sp. H39-3-25]|uniref:acyl carrier protein n=1 Tax=Sphingobium arseniciresistens TaxID=3030834 RepID=UPI0023B973D0|nr:acyl carrier protein [Sphingobium arseniciresistens]